MIPARLSQTPNHPLCGSREDVRRVRPVLAASGNWVQNPRQVPRPCLRRPAANGPIPPATEW
jgi:hypothetical protein